MNRFIDWFIDGLLGVCIILLFVCLAGFGCLIEQYFQDRKNCEKWQRTLVNVPAHMVGKIVYPESVRDGLVCVKWRDGTQ